MLIFSFIIQTFQVNGYQACSALAVRFVFITNGGNDVTLAVMLPGAGIMAGGNAGNGRAFLFKQIDILCKGHSTFVRKVHRQLYSFGTGVGDQLLSSIT